MSSQLPKRACFFRKLCKSRIKSQDRQRGQPVKDEPNPSISIPAQASTTPQLQPFDHSPKGEGHLGILISSQAPPTTSEPHLINRSTRDEQCTPGISIPAQASATPRPQPVDRCPGNEGHLAILDPSHTLPSTSEPQALGGRDAWNREAAQDSRPGFLIPSPTINHSLMEARNEDDHHIPIPIQMPLITPEHPSIVRGGGDVSREAVNGEDLDFSKSTKNPSITTEPHSVDHQDRVTQRREAPSISFFPGSKNVTITGSNFTEVHGNATTIRFGDGQFTDVQRNLICDYMANLTVLPDINDNLKKHVLTQSIITLSRVEAAFDDYETKKKSGPCFEGTRVVLLREMAAWVISPGESRMYILSGLAGIGKSTVAYTIASRAADLKLLGASFFFSRNEVNRNKAKKFFITIAYQLCVYNTTFAKAIGDVLLTERGSAVTTKDPQDQLHALILDPLRSIVQSRSRPILIVVDALDECDEEDAFSVLTGLSQLVQDLPSFKVILTTRPQPYFDYFLSSQGDHKIFHLQDIEDKVVDGDIRLYLKHMLSLEQVRKRYPKRQWRASDEQINSLVHAAGRLFIIASTAVRYILDKSASNPTAQMQKLLHAFAQDHTSFKDLDHFYTIILRNVVPEDCDDNDIVSRYQSVVGAIIFVQRPLPVSTLAHLINIDIEEIHAVLDNLQSVILLGDDDVPRIYHKSFPDHLTDQARCKDPCLQIDARICHTQIAIHCFENMDQRLKRNILGLGDPARFMSNKDSLKEDGITDEQLQEKIPQQLRYACAYWANHLKVANIENPDFMNGLEIFIDKHMLHWFEVLSLIGNLDWAHHAIRAVLNLKSTPSDLKQLLSDTLRFISKFYEVIERSALHTYYSALPFAPTDSLLYRRYIKEAEHNICTVEGGPERWDALVANLSHDEDVRAIEFSLDSALFVSWSEEFVEDGHIREQGKLKIWDAITGTPFSTISGHRFAVANDFSTIASSKDNIITFYNVNGSARGTMLTTLSKIEKLALSSESSRIAAGLSDGTVWLWDISNAELIDRSEDSGYCSELQFSPTGTRLAYSSANGIVKLRDGVSGRFIADLQCGSEYDLYFVFSGDGSRIASLSGNYNLKLWNSESGVLIGDVKDDVGDEGLAISTDGSLLATAELHKVRLWSENCHLLAQIKVLEVEAPRSIAFSLNNILVIATISDIKLYDVITHSFVSTLPCGGFPRALAFSPDCTRLAIGNWDGRVFLWDIQGINASDPLSKEKATAVIHALALSRDCSRLAYGFEDGTVDLWETSPTKRRITSHQPHTKAAWALRFSPDGGLFASGSYDETIKLWNSRDGSLRGTLTALRRLRGLSSSNSMLVAAWDGGVTLWSLDTLNPIHTFEVPNKIRSLLISDDSALIAFFHRGAFSRLSLLDAVKHTMIDTFDLPHEMYPIAFLPDNSQLVALSDDGFLSLNLVNKHITKGPVLEHLIQLPIVPRWHGVPIWPLLHKEGPYITALFSEHKSSVPVLWIPRDLSVGCLTKGSSMIAFICESMSRRTMLLRLPTSHG